MCNVLRQLKLRYTLTTKITVSPLSESFAEDLRLFAGTCRTVAGMKQFHIGAIGARTTAFKTVRFDEIAMANHRITVETIDLADVFARMDRMGGKQLEEKKAVYAALSDFDTYPPEKLENIARLGAVIDDLIAEYDLHAIAIRCWNELQLRYGIAPCLILCELDVTNAVMMGALYLAADHLVMLLDVNNNYGDSDNACIFFHCGPAPPVYDGGTGTHRGASDVPQILW